MFRLIQRVSSHAFRKADLRFGRSGSKFITYVKSDLKLTSVKKKNDEENLFAAKNPCTKRAFHDSALGPLHPTRTMLASPAVLATSTIISLREQELRLPHSDKPFIKLSAEELIEWIKQLPVTNQELRTIRNRGFAGQTFWNLFQQKGEEKVFSASLASRLRVAIDKLTENLIWAPLPTTVTEESIKEKMAELVANVAHVMKLSKDTHYQQQKLSKLIVNPLPLSSEGCRWSPYFFDDLAKSDKLMELESQLKEIREKSAQEKYILALVQMSGVGKTQLALSYAIQHGAVVMWFSRSFHHAILQQATNFIAAARQMAYGDNRLSINDQFQKEEEFCNMAVNVVKLIPLTFLEFAKYFFAEAHGKIKQEDLHLAFIRATLSSGKNLLFDMFVKNLSYISKMDSFSTFETEMLNVAFHNKLTAFIYDEVHEAETMLAGQLLQDAGALKEKHKRSLLKQLRIEQQNKFKPTANFQRQTSVFYLLMLAMEKFTAKNIPQLMISTSGSVLNQLPASKIVKERYPVHGYWVAEDPRKTLQRFYSLITSAFGTNAAVLLKKNHAVQLNRLSSRPLYLFKLFEALPYDLPANHTLEQFLQKWLVKGDAAAELRAQDYVAQAHLFPLVEDICLAPAKKDKNLKGNHKHLLLTVVKTSLSTDEIIETNPFVVQELVQLGLAPSIPAPTPLDGTQKPLQFDYYIHLCFKKLPYEKLLQMFCYLDASGLAGKLGECFVALILKRMSEYQTPLFELAPHCDMPEEIMHLKLQQNIIVTSPVDCGLPMPHLIFNEIHYSKLLPFNFQPNMLGPDSILLLKDENKVVGYLVLQTKNLKDSVGKKVFMEKALPVTNYVNFYHLGRNVAANRSHWRETMHETIKDKLWVRAVYAQGFAPEVWHMVQKWNSSEKGKKHPILLITPYLEELNGQYFPELGIPRTAGAPPPPLKDNSTINLAGLEIEYQMPQRTADGE